MVEMLRSEKTNTAFFRPTAAAGAELAGWHSHSTVIRLNVSLLLLAVVLKRLHKCFLHLSRSERSEDMKKGGTQISHNPKGVIKSYQHFILKNVYCKKKQAALYSEHYQDD